MHADPIIHAGTAPTVVQGRVSHGALPATGDGGFGVAFGHELSEGPVPAKAAMRPAVSLKAVANSTAAVVPTAGKKAAPVEAAKESPSAATVKGETIATPDSGKAANGKVQASPINKAEESQPSALADLTEPIPPASGAGLPEPIQPVALENSKAALTVAKSATHATHPVEGAASASPAEVVKAKAKSSLQPVSATDSAPVTEPPSAPLAAVQVAVVSPNIANKPEGGETAKAASTDGPGKTFGPDAKRAARPVLSDAKAAASPAPMVQADGDAAAVAPVGRETHGTSTSDRVSAEIQPGSPGAVVGAPSTAALLQTGVDGPAGLTIGAIHGPSTHVGAELRNASLEGQSSAVDGGIQGHQMLSAGPRQIEVGVQDGTHGWLQIRAELGTGGAVSASLTGNAAAHESLRQAVPELAAFLQSESVSVSGIAIHRAAESSTALGDGQGGSNQGSGADGGKDAQDTAGDSRKEASGEAQTGLASGSSGDAALGWTTGIPTALLGSSQFAGLASTASGSWLSVRA